jgi:adenylyltransferase/sulfurtransferase
MVHIDLWDGSFDRFELGPPRADCPTCGTHEFEFLNAEAGAHTTSLCGRDAVQVSVTGSRGGGRIAGGMSLPDLAERLRQGGAIDVRDNPFLLRATVDGHEFTVFPDGRAIIKGTQDEAEAATLYARYIGA